MSQALRPVFGFLLVVAMAAAPPPARAWDGDGDLYDDTAPPVDCDDGNPAVHPNAFELVDNGVDDDCFGGDVLRRFFADTRFAAPAWNDTGMVLAGPDTVKVGGPGAGRIARTLSAGRPFGGTAVIVDVQAATVSPCDLLLSYGAWPSGAGFTTVRKPFLVSPGVQMFDFRAVKVPYVLKEIAIECAAGSSVTLDWLQVQDAMVEFPPSKDLVFDWRDMRAPGAGYTTGIMRSDDESVAYMGTDVAGVGRTTGIAAGWEVAYGTGRATLALAGTMSVMDVFPLDDGSGVVYALLGDDKGGNSEIIGGLWYSPDQGDTWEKLADSLYDFGDLSPINGQWDAGETMYNPAEDDVAGSSLTGQCPVGDGVAGFTVGSGRLLQVDAHTSGDLVYIANADPDAVGVSIYDAATGDVCPMPHGGDSLPAEPIAGLLRVDVEPNGTAALVVAYKARPGDEPAVYVCELPSTPLDCSGSVQATCEAVPESAGVDVRDLQENFDDALQSEPATSVLFADAGNRPEDTNADGVVDTGCGREDPGVDLLELDDSLGAVDVVSYGRVATENEIPAIADQPLTGISMDPAGMYVFVNVPASAGAQYGVDRMYRVEAGSIGLGQAWTPVNQAEDDSTPMEDEDVREGYRRAHLDLSGAWLEAEISGVERNNPFPARTAPGTGHDTEFLTWRLTGPEFWVAAVSTYYNAWAVTGMDEPWTDDFSGDSGLYLEDAEEETDWVFWPDIDPNERRTYQGAVVNEVAIDADGHVYAAASDLGLIHLDGTIPQTYPPNGAEVDCLWSGWRAGANSVALGLDDSLWLTLYDEAISDDDTETAYPQSIGVLRSRDHAATWEYAAAGYQPDNPMQDPVMSFWHDTPPDRSCRDLEFVRATAFDAASASTPGTQFAVSASPEMVSGESVGNPAEVRALSDQVAITLFAPQGGSYPTQGGLYLTLDGGESWEEIGFDGGTDGCDRTDSLEGGQFELIHPGGGSYAVDADKDGTAEDYVLDLLFGVLNQGASAPTNTSGEYTCSLARVTVEPDGAGGLLVDWHWILVPAETAATGSPPSYSGRSCAVTGRLLAGLSVAPWANEAYVWGSYIRDFKGASPGVLRGFWGGACVLDLDTETFSMLLDPADHHYAIGYVAPHPEVADLLAILPQITEATWSYCQVVRDDTTLGTCDYPAILLADHTHSGWALTEMSNAPPSPRPLHATWSPLNTAGEEEGERAAWLVVATGGSGAWRGRVTW